MNLLTPEQIQEKLRSIPSPATRATVEFDPMPLLPAIFKQYPNWVTFQDKDHKQPIMSGSLSPARSNDPTTWVSYRTACENIKAGRGYPNLGWVPDGIRTKFLTAIDIDGCRNPETGELRDWAQKIVTICGATYVEVTPSQTGIRVWIVAEFPKEAANVYFLAKTAGYGRKVQVEIYNDGKYFTVTGKPIPNSGREVLPLNPDKIVELFNYFELLERQYPAGQISQKKDKIVRTRPVRKDGTIIFEAVPPDDGFKHLFEVVGWKPFEDRLKKMEDKRFHDPVLEPGKLMYCPMPEHRPRGKDVPFQSKYFGVMPDGDIACCIVCQWSGDMVKACRDFDAGEEGGKIEYKNMYDVARQICRENNLTFEDYFPKEIAVTISVVPEQHEIQSIVEPSLPVSAMSSTRLGDIYVERFEPYGWPLELALPALATAAGVVVPPGDSRLIGGDPMTTLYTGLIGPVHCGKSQAIEWAAKSLGIFVEGRGKYYYELKSGSAEQLMNNLDKYSGSFGRNILVNPDEWSHLFSKAAIPDASFTSVLTSSFYRRSQTFTNPRGRDFTLNLGLSLIGGIVEDDFDTVFNFSTLGGLYDRFLFGLSPKGFMFDYRPYPFEMRNYEGDFDDIGWSPVSVVLDGSLFEVIKHWNKEKPELGRIVEVCARVAIIFASMDGRTVVTGGDLEALQGLADYQLAVRNRFQPNPGLSPDAVYGNAAAAWAKNHAKEWKPLSAMKHALQRYERKYGAFIAQRAIESLAYGGRLQLWKGPETDRNPFPADYTGPKVKFGLVRRTPLT